MKKLTPELLSYILHRFEQSHADHEFGQALQGEYGELLNEYLELMILDHMLTKQLTSGPTNISNMLNMDDASFMLWGEVLQIRERASNRTYANYLLAQELRNDPDSEAMQLHHLAQTLPEGSCERRDVERQFVQKVQPHVKDATSYFRFNAESISKPYDVESKILNGGVTHPFIDGIESILED